MALPDLTGQNIQDTYQRLVQVDATGSFTDGTGSNLPISIEGDNVRVTGDIIANQYVVSSSVTNITTQQLSGSTAFGDSGDDIHAFTGSVSITGSTVIRHGGNAGTQTQGFVVTPEFQHSLTDYIILGGNVIIDQKKAQESQGIVPSAGTNYGNVSASGYLHATNFIQGSGYAFSNLGTTKTYFSYNTTTDQVTFGGAAQPGSYSQKVVQLVQIF